MSIIVLNKNYQFWCEVDLRRAVKWIIKDKIEVLVDDETREIRCLNVKMPIIVRLLDFIGYRAKDDKIPFNENAVYWRDDNVCQYWHHDADGRRFKYQCTVHDRTIDHVVPRSKGGKKSFENCVCACITCNIKIKKNRRPEEADLELLRKPFVPTRRKGELILGKFVYDPRKPSHRVYMERILGRYSHPASEPAVLEPVLAA
jgi:5-methylcytosine-specific restriction endonuclease McrA